MLTAFPRFGAASLQRSVLANVLKVSDPQARPQQTMCKHTAAASRVARAAQPTLWGTDTPGASHQWTTVVAAAVAACSSPTSGACCSCGSCAQAKQDKTKKRQQALLQELQDAAAKEVRSWHVVSSADKQSLRC